MRIKFLFFLIPIATILCSCFGDCGREDYGQFEISFFNQQDERLAGVDVAVYALRSGEFRFHNANIQSFDSVLNYYGLEIFTTDSLGKIFGEASSFAVSSCDVSDITSGNAFQSIVVFYECNSNKLEHQEFLLYNDSVFLNQIKFIDEINVIDSVIVETKCFE